jgi:hypothetical protein
LGSGEADGGGGENGGGGLGSGFLKRIDGWGRCENEG